MTDRLSPYAGLLACVIIAIILWIATGANAAPPRGWHVFSVFIAVIVSFILRPFPMGTMVVLGLVVLTATQTITIKEALSGYGDYTVWLVVAAFLIAGGVVHTGFGRRLALVLVKALGSSHPGPWLFAVRQRTVVGSSRPFQHGPWRGHSRPYHGLSLPCSGEHPG